MCKFEGCISDPHPKYGPASKYHGYCSGHIAQLLKGIELRPKKWIKNQDSLERIMSKATLDAATGCLVMECHSGDSYPKVYVNKQKLYAHRAVYELVHGPITPGSVIHHKCGNGGIGCVTADHLQMVTPIENTAEMYERNTYVKKIAELEEALAAAVAERDAALAELEKGNTP